LILKRWDFLISGLPGKLCIIINAMKMQNLPRFISGKSNFGIYRFLIIVLFSYACSSECRKMDALFGDLARKDEVTVIDWERLTQYLGNNRNIYEKCAGELYTHNGLNKDAILNRISAAARNTPAGPDFSRDLILDLINRLAYKEILGGAGLQQVKDRLNAFAEDHRDLFTGKFPGLYSDKSFTAGFFSAVYDSQVIFPRLYLERSGSMVFYDSGNRNFVTAMRQIINRFPQHSLDRKLVYVVSDRIAHWDITFSDFLQTANIFSATQGMVNPSWTDFPGIFRDILGNTADNQISILFSDMIYDVHAPVPGISPEGFANQAQEMTHAVFNTHGNDFGFIILKMNGDYNGIYYPPLANPFAYSGNRPYYICLIGKTGALDKLMTQDTYRAVKEFNTLPGFESSHAFYRVDNSPWYSVLTPHNMNSRYVQPARASIQTGRIDQLENARVYEREGSFRFVVAADLSGLWFDDSFKTDPRNYRISSRDDFYIDEIVPVRQEDVSSAAKRYLQGSTHLIILKTDRLNNPRQEIMIEVINEFPQWLKGSSTLNDDGNIAGFPNRTFGLEQMVRGIYNAFYQSEGNSIMSLKIELI
jgi:hypothetical protein